MKIKKIFTGLALFGAMSATSLSLVSCSHSTLSKINDNSKYLFGGQGIFLYDETKSTWSTEKTLASGNYIIVVGNSGDRDTWRMLFDNSTKGTFPSNAYETSVLKPQTPVGFGGALTRFLSSANADGTTHGKWLSDNHIKIALMEYKASRNNDNASSSKSDYATKYVKIVKELHANESGSLAFFKGSSVVTSDKDKHIDPSKGQFNLSTPAANNYNNLIEQLKNIYSIK